jgi:peptidyl-prolyl cis-trans isomerase SurA
VRKIKFFLAGSAAGFTPGGLLRSFFLALLLFCVPESLPAQAAQRTEINRVAAVVNGELITLYDLQRQAMQEFMRQSLLGSDNYSEMRRREVMREVLNSMILDILLRQEAERYKVLADEKEVENELRQIMQSNRLSQEEFERRLAAEGSSLDELKGRIRDSILRQRIMTLMVARKVQISQSEIEQYYHEHIEEFSVQDSVELSVIVFPAGMDPHAVRERIVSGELDFALAARQYSKAPNASIGGSMGSIPWKDLNQIWRQALAGLEPGRVSPVLWNGADAILLHIDALEAASAQPLEEVAPRIEAAIRDPRLRERFDEYTGQLRSQAMVDIRI